MVVDANVLVYAFNSRSTHHRAAREWLETALSGSSPVLIPWISLLAFVRLSTSPRIFTKPLTVDVAMEEVATLLNAPSVRIPAADAGVAGVLRQNLTATGTGGNLTNDAFIAALAVQNGAAVVSFDNDFSRFPDVEWIKPG